MFNFFSRKSANASSVSLPESNVQLRTPSPSVSIDKAAPTTSLVPPPTPSPEPSNAGITSDSPDVDAVVNLVASVPPKTVHAYILDRLPTLSTPSTSAEAILSFFSELQPPPRMHCVRCHKFYFDVDNNDRSCLVPHDDDSAEVERAGLGKSQTLYSCCEKTVEGDGDQGPPDGWCFEGLHTTDVKRARFRADSSPSDDKLASCTRLRCFNPRASPPSSTSSTSSFVASPEPTKRRRTAVKRARPAKEEDDEPEQQQEKEDQEEQPEAGPSSISASDTKPRPKKRRRKAADPTFKPTQSADEDDASHSDVEMTDSTAVKRPSRARKSKKVAPSSSSMMPESISTPGPTRQLSPTGKGKGVTRKKSSVSFSESTITVSKQGIKGSMKTKTGALRNATKPKALNEVISSSIDGET